MPEVHAAFAFWVAEAQAADLKGAAPGPLGGLCGGRAGSVGGAFLFWSLAEGRIGPALRAEEPWTVDGGRLAG